MERASRLIDGPDRRPGQAWGVRRCEIIERADCVVAVLDIPGREASELMVSLDEEEMRVEGPGLGVRAPLPCLVDPLGLSSEYRNGILSVKIMKPT